MLKFYILDENHQPVEEPDFQRWSRWMYGWNGKNSIVKQTEVSPEVLVSTIFLGMDQAFIGYGPPIFFETMVFADDDNGNRDQWRYSTWDDALANHEGIVRKMKAKLKEKTNGRQDNGQP